MCGYQGPGAVSRKAGPDTMPVLHSLLAISISLCVRIKDGHSPGWLFPSHLTDGLHSLQAIRDTTRKAVEKLSLFPGEVQQEEEVAVSVPGRGSSQGAGRGGRVCPWQREPAEDWACLFLSALTIRFAQHTKGAYTSRCFVPFQTHDPTCELLVAGGFLPWVNQGMCCVV